MLIYLKSRMEIETALKNTIPVLSSAITTFSQIKEQSVLQTHVLHSVTFTFIINA
ncbi:hypothetical protein E2C01_000768 [Portunus trituberculatus]|uniref:Uncharacterized protein n=1 Tax=Portunus trituberculatus TaxID=210409 RepID=A0A5B7CHG5_PORTR|nr:hypothetical protein [Portunus trituberculatus]